MAYTPDFVVRAWRWAGEHKTTLFLVALVVAAILAFSAIGPAVP